MLSQVPARETVQVYVFIHVYYNVFLIGGTLTFKAKYAGLTHGTSTLYAM